MHRFNINSKTRFLVLLLFFVYGALPAQKAPEIFEQEIKGVKKVKFQNKNTLRATREKLEFDTKVGESLATDSPKDPILKSSDISILHLPSKSNKLGADLLTIGKKFKVGHINTIKRIMSSYIQKEFDYEEKEANILSYYVLYYNVLYRKNLKYFKTKYDREVVKNFNQELLGISKKYSDWPGNTQIVIPLSKNILKDKKNDLTISELKDSVNKDLDKKNKGSEIKQELNSLLKEKVDSEKKLLDEKKKDAEQKTNEIEKVKAENEEKLKKQELSTEEKAKLEKEQIALQKEKENLEKNKKELETKEKELTKIEKQLEKEIVPQKTEAKDAEVAKASVENDSKKEDKNKKESESKKEESPKQKPEETKVNPQIAKSESPAKNNEDLKRDEAKEETKGKEEKSSNNLPAAPPVVVNPNSEVNKPDAIALTQKEPANTQINGETPQAEKPVSQKQDLERSNDARQDAGKTEIAKVEQVPPSKSTPAKTPDAAEIQKQLDEKSKQLDEKSKELTELKKSIQEKDAKSENIIGERVLFLQVVKYENDGHFTNDLWVLDPDEEEGLYKSPFENICGRDFKVLKSGVLVIGFEGQESDSSIHHLVLLDSETLAVKKISKENVLWRSQLFVREGKIYTFELMNDKKIYLSRFSEELDFEARSSEPVNINSDISFNKSKVFVTSKLQGNDATTIMVLNKDDLKVSKNFKPTPKRLMKK